MFTQRPDRFYSIDSAKAIKANAYGYLNAINYMAPSTSGGVGNLCSHASPQCILFCLGEHSGQAAMHAPGESNPVLDSRKRKAQYFMRNRTLYMCEMLLHSARLIARARKLELKLVLRPNGSTDIAYESIRVFVTPEFALELSKISGVTVSSGLHSLMTAFPTVQIVDYTKNPIRMKRMRASTWPANYHLTFSRSEVNDAECLEVLASGQNVAVVFKHGLPRTWHGYRVIDGDKHDLRQLDPKGVVVGLSPKGNKLKKSNSPFMN